MLRDCGRVLMHDEKNMKALYRSAKACLAIDKLAEAEDAITRALATDQKNPTFEALKSDIERRKAIVDARDRKAAVIASRKREEEHALKLALRVFLRISLTKESRNNHPTNTASS